MRTRGSVLTDLSRDDDVPFEPVAARLHFDELCSRRQRGNAASSPKKGETQCRQRTFRPWSSSSLAARMLSRPPEKSTITSGVAVMPGFVREGRAQRQGFRSEKSGIPAIDNYLC